MSTDLFYDSDDERDSFDVERQQIEKFRRHCLFASSESSSDDDEGIIDGTKVPSSSKAKNRVRRSFLDISLLSNSSVNSIEEENSNPFEIISKSIDVQTTKKSKKTIGLPKARLVPETTDIYDQDETNNQQEKNEKKKSRKPTKNDVLETERKMQEFSRSEQLILPKFVPKRLENFQSIGQILRKSEKNVEKICESTIEKNQNEPTVESTLNDLTKLIEEKIPTKIDRLSRFLNAEILKKKPTISAESSSLIDLSENKKPSNVPTVKNNFDIFLEPPKINSTNKKLSQIQTELGVRMKEKRAALLADNFLNVPIEDEHEDEEKSEMSIDESQTDSEIISNCEDQNENEILPMDEEETNDLNTDEEDEIYDEEEVTNPPPSDPNRPSLKTVLSRMESMEPTAIRDENGQTEWFAAAEPAPIDENLEMLCSGVFGGENAIPPSQNITQREPLPFSPLPATQIDDDDDDFISRKSGRNKVRQIVDEDEPMNSASTVEQNDDEEQNEEEEEEEEDLGENEELLDYKKQWFEVEAEESGSEVDEKRIDDDDENDDDEPDEELAKFIDTAAIEMDEDEADNLAKVHLKLKAKEDEQKLKMLKEQYLQFDGDDDGRRILIGKGRAEDDDEDENDPSYNSDAEDEEEEEEEEDDPVDLTNRLNELERQRSMQDNQAEEVHLDADLENIGQNSSMFQKGLALKKKILPSNNEPKKSVPTKSVTLSSVLLAQRFSSTLLATNNKNNLVPAQNPTTNTAENSLTNKKQLNPRRHVFAPNENQNPTTTSGEKRANSTEKSPSTKIKRFKKSATTSNTKAKETSTSVFSALALSTVRQ